jgi:catechol 2,3-dioxygenase-like lactoylglutathione lyase family enzyme
MSRFLGEIRQLGYVVHDIEAAMDYWSTTLGVGPWFYNPKVPIQNYRYNGEAHEPHNSVALASMYRDFLRAGRTGLQHVAYWTADYDADLARLTAQGFKPVMSGEVGERGRFIYFDTEYHPGTVIELSEVAGPKGKMFDLIRSASEGWDGSEPVRPFPDLSKL